MDDSLYVMILVTLVGYSESLECLSCSDVANIDGCNATTSCSTGQSCNHNIASGRHSLGCVNNKDCDSHAAVSTIIGRDIASRTTSTCFECCSTDRCNFALCHHPEPKQCVDDESVDCAQMNSLFSICSDIVHAKKVCAKFCGLCTVDGNWTLWSSWSKCDVTCENGHQTRTRTCTNPAPLNGGLDCVGDGMMTKVCRKDQQCPVHGGWSVWSQWGTCSVTCGMGLQRRTRTCSNPPPSFAGNHCFGDNTESQLCMSAPCANGGWSDWTPWSTCSTTCGGGIRSQTRSCSNPPPSPYGQSCVGSNDRVESCSNNNCETTHCVTDQCVHGQCYDVLHDFLCLCHPGYAGRYCNISLGNNFCDPNPCSHGTCKPDINGFKCNCFDGYVGRNCDIINATDCYDIRHKNIASKSGVYNVTLSRSKVVREIYCDMETDNGGWTVFQNRFDGSVNFTRTFNEYIEGFGSYSGEYWLGLKYIEEMAANLATELRLDLTAADNSIAYEVFLNFHLGSSPGYELHIDRGTGTAGDSSGLSYNNGRRFSTYDHNDKYNCALREYRGWWYTGCAYAGLNGQYFQPGTTHGDLGVRYYDFKGWESLKTTRMMFRRMK